MHLGIDIKAKITENIYILRKSGNQKNLLPNRQIPKKVLGIGEKSQNFQDRQEQRNLNILEQRKTRQTFH